MPSWREGSEEVRKRWEAEGEEDKKRAAEAEEERVAKNRARRQKGPKSKSAPVADADATAPSPAHSSEPPVDNQGLPGSANNKGGPMGGVEDGQRLQEEADRRALEGKTLNMKPSWEADNLLLQLKIQELNKRIDDRDKDVLDVKEELRKMGNALKQDELTIHEMEIQLEESKKESAASMAEAQTEKQRVTITKGVIEQLKQEVASVTSKLADTTHEKHQLEADKDEAEVVINGLHERIDALESEVTSRDAVATENNSLQGQIADVHTCLEDAFSDMAKGLTIEEKFTYLRERQAAAPTPRPRIVSGASLHQETDNVSDSDSCDAPALKQTLTFAGITSVETAPIAAIKSTAPLNYADIISIDTVPISAPAAASSIAAAKPTASLEFSDVATIETASTVAPAASPEFTPLRTPATRTRLLAMSMSDDAPLEPVSVKAALPAPAPRVIVKTKRIYIEKPVDRPVVPWWMWALFLLGIIACIGGFAGLLREKQIWLDANDLAYERLMGGQQETWMEWIGMGIGDLLPDMGSGMMGHSMFA
jgi:hypothetical protein